MGEREWDRDLVLAYVQAFFPFQEMRGLWREAITWNGRGLRDAKTLPGDRQIESVILNNLGLAYARLGDVRRAIGYHEQALAIAREIGDIHVMATSSLGLALLYA